MIKAELNAIGIDLESSFNKLEKIEIEVRI